MTLRAVAGVSGGSGPITEPLVLASYVVADLPDPAIAFSNGTQWIYLAPVA